MTSPIVDPPPTDGDRPAGLAYDGPAGARDLRIDFLRGVAMTVLLVVHFELFSAVSLLAWERVGLIAGAEGFVILAGVVIGMVQRHVLARDGWKAAIGKLLDRAAQLWRVNVAVIVLIGLARFVPFLDDAAVTSFTDRGSGQIYQLYPHDLAPQAWIAKAFTLQMGPHQLQILGLYVALLLLTPLGLFAFRQGRTGFFLGACWVVYFLNALTPMRPTMAQFEYGFPLLTWQLIWFHGLAAGWHRDDLARFMAGQAGRVVLAGAFGVFFACLFLAQNHTNPFLPAWATIHVIPPATFDWLYAAWFQKNALGLGRLLNYAAALTVGYAVLTWWWRPLHRAFGWYFVPIGQATLYVFIVHVFLIMAVTQVWPFGFQHDRWLPNTLVHLGVLATAWLLVRFQVLYRWIPR